MAVGAYRPWGLLPWVMAKLPQKSWSVLGTLSPEERCLAAWNTIKRTGLLGSTYFAEIEYLSIPRYAARTEQKLLLRRSEFARRGGSISDLHAHEFFETSGDMIAWVEEFLSSAGASLIVDITSFPKKFFFPLLKIIRARSEVQNLIVTYTLPASYPPKEIPLSENFGHWRSLPLFSGKLLDTVDLVIVNVGYVAMGLPEELKERASGRQIKLILPFPDLPDSYHRNLSFVREIEKNVRQERIQLTPISTNDMPDAFDHLSSWTEDGELGAILAPYGPKPLSLAMCLFAIEADLPVYYTQPRTYNPDYSIGISYVNRKPETYAYCIRLAGNDYFSIR